MDSLAAAVTVLAKAVLRGRGFGVGAKAVVHVLALGRIQDLLEPREVGKVAL